MRRIGERIEQAHGDRLDLLGQQRIDGALGVGAIERALDRGPGIDPLVDDLAQIALDQRRRLLPGEVVERGMRSVRISSTSRKPLVVIRPTRAPLCSRMALEATVVP